MLPKSVRSTLLSRHLNDHDVELRDDNLAQIFGLASTLVVDDIEALIHLGN